MEDVPPKRMELQQEGPIEIAPGSELEVDERHQDEEDDYVRDVLFIFHPMRTCRGAHVNHRRHAHLKVNESASRVNAEKWEIDQRRDAQRRSGGD